MSKPVSSYLAFDLGASSGCALAGTLEGQYMKTEEVYRFETPLVEEGDRLCWNLRVLEQELSEGLRRAVEEVTNLRSVSVDSWAVDYVPMDGDGAPLRNPYCYRDPRTHDVMDWTLRQMSREDVYAVTGIQFIPINTLYQVLADQRMEPERADETTERLFIADYFHYRLCGRRATEPSMASTTQLMDVHTRDWSAELMEHFGIDPGTWPEIVPSGTKLGPLALDGDRLPRDSSPSGIEVIVGCSHDTACAVAAVPADPDGSPWAYISCGTWSLLGVERSEPVLADAARTAGFTNEIGLDGTVRFLKNLTGLWVLQECERVWRSQGHRFDYATLQGEAAEARSMEPVDLNESRFVERGQMPTKLQNYCREHGRPVPETRGEFVRLILESLATDYRDKLNLLEDVIGRPIEVLHLVGGGSRNELLCQWTADITSRRVVAGPAEAAALGNLLIQARAMGDLPDGTSIRDIARASTDLRTYHPAEVAAL